jgi:hypothetical protein
MGRKHVMMDEHFDRDYQAGRAELRTGVEALLARLRRAIAANADALHRINFSAPWTDPRSR